MKSQTTRVRSDLATQDRGNVRLGDMAPVFDRSAGPPRAEAKKVEHDPVTQDSGKVRLGDMAPSF